ncbi:hypothetical protein JW859_05930 [bacterium]|nr:hypothetical protein [bacterium]
MNPLITLVSDSEDWLMERILAYAKRQKYTQYTSTLAEAWRASIAGLSASLIESIRQSHKPQEFQPQEDFSNNPSAAFGVKEAKLHRSRGIQLGMFLGLMKYYRQSYLDLVEIAQFSPRQRAQSEAIILRFFDSVELGFLVEWVSHTTGQLTQELQVANRLITNEKNKFLTIFESLPSPVVLLNATDEIENMNSAAAKLFKGLSVPGAIYYNPKVTGERIPWLAKELVEFHSTDQDRCRLEKLLECHGEQRHFIVQLHRMLDVSEKFTGTVVFLLDIEERRRVEEALRKQERREAELAAILAAAGTTAHEINNPLTGVIAVLESIANDPGAPDVGMQAQEALSAALRIKQAILDMEAIREPAYRPYLDKRWILDLDLGKQTPPLD